MWKWLYLWLPWQDEKEAAGIYNIFVDNTFILQKYLLNKELNQLIHDYHLSENSLYKSENEWKFSQTLRKPSQPGFILISS